MPILWSLKSLNLGWKNKENIILWRFLHPHNNIPHLPIFPTCIQIFFKRFCIREKVWASFFDEEKDDVIVKEGLFRWGWIVVVVVYFSCKKKMEMVMMAQMGAVNFIAPSQCKLGGSESGYACLSSSLPSDLWYSSFPEGVFGCKMWRRAWEEIPLFKVCTSWYL